MPKFHYGAPGQVKKPVSRFPADAEGAIVMARPNKEHEDKFNAKKSVAGAGPSRPEADAAALQSFRCRRRRHRSHHLEPAEVASGRGSQVHVRGISAFARDGSSPTNAFPVRYGDEERGPRMHPRRRDVRFPPLSCEGFLTLFRRGLGKTIQAITLIYTLLSALDLFLAVRISS